MKSICSKFFVITFLFALTSCDKELYLDSKIEPSLVLTSFISPQDTILSVRLTQSSPILNQSNAAGTIPLITNASIGISNGSITGSLTFNELSRSYELSVKNFPIISGETYVLTAEVPDGRIAHASCTVPNPNFSLNVFFEKLSPEQEESDWEIVINWDKGDQSSFGTRVTGTVLHSWTFDSVTFFTEFNALELNEILKDNQEGDSFSIGTTYKYPKGLASTKRCIVTLLNIDEHYFKYYQSLSQNPTDDPFAQPVFTYSNVNGGLGVFCAFNRVEVQQVF